MPDFDFEFKQTGLILENAMSCSKRPMPALVIICICLASTITGPALANGWQPLTEACEIALAKSALPAHLRERANSWVLTDEGFVRKGDDADFSCLVARNHADSLIPQCFDRPGQRAILPKYLEEGRMMAAGQDFAQIKARIDARLKAREYDPVDGYGLVYMISAYNYIYAQGAGQVVHVHPHVMFHAPDIKPEAVGNTLRQGMMNKGLPFIIDEGVHGYMISMVDQPSDSSTVEAACKGQLPPAPAPMQ